MTTLSAAVGLQSDQADAVQIGAMVGRRMNQQRREQIATAVIALTKTRLESGSTASLTQGGEYTDGLDEFLCNMIRQGLLQFHQEVLPFSILDPSDGALIFLSVPYYIEVTRAWERNIVEVRFVPRGPHRRIDTDFSDDFRIEGCQYTNSLRLYPPRADVMFEFHGPLVRDIVQDVMRTGEAVLISDGA